MISEELERDGGQDGGKVIGAMGDQDGIVADFSQAASLATDSDDRSFASFDFLNIAEVFFEHGIFRSDEDARHVWRDESDDAVFQFRAGVAACVDVGDLLHFQGTLECDGVVEFPPEEHHRLHVCVLRRDCTDLGVQREDSSNFIGERLEFAEDLKTLT